MTGTLFAPAVFGAWFQAGPPASDAVVRRVAPPRCRDVGSRQSAEWLHLADYSAAVPVPFSRDDSEALLVRPAIGIEKLAIGDVIVWWREVSGPHSGQAGLAPVDCFGSVGGRFWAE